MQVSLHMTPEEVLEKLLQLADLPSYETTIARTKLHGLWEQYEEDISEAITTLEQIANTLDTLSVQLNDTQDEVDTLIEGLKQ